MKRGRKPKQPAKKAGRPRGVKNKSRTQGDMLAEHRALYHYEERGASKTKAAYIGAIETENTMRDFNAVSLVEAPEHGLKYAGAANAKNESQTEKREDTFDENVPPPPTPDWIERPYKWVEELDERSAVQFEDGRSSSARLRAERIRKRIQQ